MKQTVNLCLVFILFLSAPASFAQDKAQNPDASSAGITKADSIIAYASNRQVIDFLETGFNGYDQNSGLKDNSLCVSLYENIKIVQMADSLWLSALCKNKLSLSGKFSNAVILPPVQSLYQQFASSYSEGKLFEAAVYFYRADYLRVSFIFAERKRILENFRKTERLIKDHKYTEARQMVNEFHDKDYFKLDYLLLRDSLASGYQLIKDKLWQVENEPQWGEEHQPGKWRFSFGADYLANPYSLQVPWYFYYPGLTESEIEEMKMYARKLDNIKTESQVNYSAGAAYCFNKNIDVCIDASYSVSSLSFETIYLLYYYYVDFSGKTRQQKINLTLSGQYNMEFSSGILTWLKVGGGMCFRQLDDVTVESRTVAYPHKPIGSETSSSPTGLAELGIGKLFGKNGTYGLAANVSVIHNFKQLDYITRTGIFLGLKILFVIR